MKIHSLQQMYHDRFYHLVNPNHPVPNTLKHLADHATPDYIVHLSPEAVRLHREHVAKSTNP